MSLPRLRSEFKTDILAELSASLNALTDEQLEFIESRVEELLSLHTGGARIWVEAISNSAPHILGDRRSYRGEVAHVLLTRVIGD